MANGQRYNYESPLDRLLNYTIPTMINEERTRQDREVYREELADERETDRIEEKRRWDAKYNQETNRYTAKLREEEDDELYNRGRDKLEFILKEPNLIKRKAALDALDATALHPSISELVTSSQAGLEASIGEIKTNMKAFDGLGFTEGELKRIQNQYSLGTTEGAHQVADKIISSKYSTPWIKTESLLIKSEIEGINKELAGWATIDTEEAKTRRSELEKKKSKFKGQLADLYDQDRPFSPSSYREEFNTSISTQLEEAGFQIKNKEQGAELFQKHSDILAPFRKEYITGPNASDYTPAQRSEAAQNVINTIIEKEKQDPFTPKPTTGAVETGLDFLGPTGLALTGVGLYKGATAEGTKKAATYLTDKAVTAATNISKIVKMPAVDVIKFVQSAHSEQVGSIGKSMPKLQRLIDKVEASADKPRSKRYKNAVKALDRQVNTVADGLYKNKVVSESLKREDLIKLLKNPGKYRFPKVIAQIKRKYRPLKKGAAKWGIFSASMKMGEALGDPTAGLATGVAVTQVAPKVQKMAWSKVVKAYKNNPKKFIARLNKGIGKSASRRVAQYLANPATKAPNPYVQGGLAIGGSVLFAKDIYDIIRSPGE